LRRIILWIVTIVLLGSAAVWLLRRDASHIVSTDAEVNTEGHFMSDSLGVTLFLPPSEGWSFRRDPPVPGGPYITAVHASGRATVRLFVLPAQPMTTLEDIIERRRAQFASTFGVDSLSQVIGHVMQEEIRDLDGYPTLQWQAMTRPVSLEEGKQARIMFMWTVSLRQERSYECIAMMLIPTDLLPEEEREYDALVQDVASIMESFRIR